MIDDEILSAFESSCMGWLTDAGELLPCELHEHMQRLAAVPRFRESYQAYDHMCRFNDAWMQSELASLSDGEHAAMHRFDGLNDDAKAALVKVVYEAGWIRLGRTLDIEKVAGMVEPERRGSAYLDPANFFVEAEGLTPAVRGHRRTLDGIVARLGSGLRLREMKYVTVDFGRRRKPDLRELLVPEAYQPNGRG